MKIKNKRITALAVAFFLSLSGSSVKAKTDVSLCSNDIIYGVIQKEKEFVKDCLKNNASKAYVNQEVSIDDSNVEAFQTVGLCFDFGNKYLICNESGDFDLLEKETVEKLPDSYVEVDISDQNLRFYKDNKIVMSTDVVTGKNSSPTDIGFYEIDYKTTNVTLEGYNEDGSKYASPVSYWMPFNGGEGLHDATWRSYFGGSIYEYGGSHGCVNMPYSSAQELYNQVDAGTKVLVHK